jgi:hypothetical protein
VWGLLADHDRLRVFGALALDPGTAEQVAARTGLSARVVLAALAKLESGGAVRVLDGVWSVDLASLRQHAREAGTSAAPHEEQGLEPRVAAVLRAFLRDGRLLGIPSAGQAAGRPRPLWRLRRPLSPHLSPRPHAWGLVRTLAVARRP